MNEQPSNSDQFCEHCDWLLPNFGEGVEECYNPFCPTNKEAESDEG